MMICFGYHTVFRVVKQLIDSETVEKPKMSDFAASKCLILL